MPPFLRSAELPPELFCRIGGSLDLKSYCSARGSCKAWRCALAPPSPSLLLVPDDVGCCPSAASLSTHRTFKLKAFPAGAERVVGASNGWLALAAGWSIFSLFNPVTATEIALPPLVQESGKWVSKLVFAPCPAGDDFAAAAIYGTDTLAYVTAGARRWAVLDPLRLAHGDHLADLLYHEKEKGRVYCLTSYGDVHVLRLPPGDLLNAASTVEPLLSLPFDADTSLEVSMYAEDVPGLKGNCVYWIGGSGRDQGMVFDMATGRSTSCLPPAAAAGVAQQRTVCWYFLKDMVMNNCNNRVY